MNQKKLAKWLKLIIFGVGICGAIIYFYIFPFWGRAIIAETPEFSYAYIPWLIFLWITAGPCYVVLICGWRIASEIEKDNSFSEVNARYLKIISYLAAGDCLLFFGGNIIFLFLHMNFAEIVLLSLIIVFFGVFISVISAALSHLVYKAAELEEESQLTI